MHSSGTSSRFTWRPGDLATWQNQAEAARLLLDHGANIGHSHWWYRSWNRLLPLARSRGFEEIVEMLEMTMKSRFCYDAKFDAFSRAASSENQNCIEEVIGHYPNLIGMADAKGQNLIHLAVLAVDRSLIDLAINAGADIDHRRADGMTPLLLAIHGDCWRRWTGPKAAPYRKIVDHLLSCGAEDELCVAVARGDEVRARELLAAQPKLATELNAARQSPLLYAAKAGHARLVELLLDHGADPNAPEWNSETGAALHGASGENNIDVMEILLERGASPNGELDSSGNCYTIVEHWHKTESADACNLLRRYGATPAVYESPENALNELRRANSSGDLQLGTEEYLSLILEHDDEELVDVLVRLSGDEVVRSMTAESGFPRSRTMLERLIGYGLDIRKTDWCGQTMLHHAASCDVPADLLQAFIEHGADLDARDLEFNATPREHALKAGRPENAKHLPGSEDIPVQSAK